VPDLPAEPSLQQLRHQARDLQRAVRQGDADALAEVATRHPAGRQAATPEAAGFPLSAAQLVVARRYGFPSWTRLRRYVEVVERYSRFPERMPADGPQDPAGEFLRLGCLYYEDDQPERWARARQVLAAHPEITELSVSAAAAAADVPRLLLEAGADPNDGQALYNRMFEPGNDHLELLLEFGLGTGDGGPWKARMGDALDPPEQLLRGELSWAIAHGMTERVRLLADHGVDLVAPFPDGTTPAGCAATTGLGADPDLRDQRFDSTPLGWARYFGQEQLVVLLEPLTAPEGP
jgi:hypothetical protein